MVYSPARRVVVRVCSYYGEGDRYDFPFYPDRVFFWGSDHAGDDPFLKPEKCVIISSFKSKREIPILFQAVRKVNLMEFMPKRLFSSTDFITNAFNRLVYNASNSDLAEYMTVTDPVYIKWAVEQITDWVPDNKSEHLYHIHGTADQIFPYDRLENVFPVEGGDHLMVVKKADTVSSILDIILLKKEE